MVEGDDDSEAVCLKIIIDSGITRHGEFRGEGFCTDFFIVQENKNLAVHNFLLK